MDICIRRYPCIAYDGTNSADILALGQDNEHAPDILWTIHSETDGVLTMKLAANPTDRTDFALYPMQVGDYLIGAPLLGVHAVVPAAQFAAQWQILAQ